MTASKCVRLREKPQNILELGLTLALLQALNDLLCEGRRVLDCLSLNINTIQYCITIHRTHHMRQIQ
jgi:hypothetical protein